MAKLRLNKILAQAGLTSRRGGDRLIVDGHVAVNGAVTRSPATLADPELDAITVDGRPLAAAEAVRAAPQAPRLRHLPQRPPGASRRRRPRGPRGPPVSGRPPRLGRRGRAP